MPRVFCLAQNRNCFARQWPIGNPQDKSQPLQPVRAPQNAMLGKSSNRSSSITAVIVSRRSTVWEYLRRRIVRKLPKNGCRVPVATRPSPPYHDGKQGFDQS